MFVHCCHCTDCQTQTGGAFAINAIIERDRVEILDGAPIVVTLATNSGARTMSIAAANARPHCGATMAGVA